MTVLLGLVAASITLVIVKTSLDNARNNAARRAYDVAYAAARAGAEETARRLSNDPLNVLRTVGDDEPSRVCDAVQVDGAPLVVAAGQAWPADCGGAWTYEQAEGSTRVWIRPPSATDPALLIRTIVEVAGTQAGVELRMLPGRTSALTVSSESSLNLGELRRGDGAVTITGLVLSGGTLSVPSSGMVFAPDTALAGESGVSGTFDEEVRRYGPVPSAGTPSVADIRRQVDAPLTAGMLRGRAAELAEAACPGGTMRNATPGSTDLCLQEGRTLVDAAGTTVNAPANVAAWLLLPGRSGENTIDVFYRVSASDEALTCPPAEPNCSLPQLAAATAGHPALLSSWTQLGSFRRPGGGLVATDTTTHLGLCGSAGVGQSSTCAVYGQGADAGVTATSGLTVVVGTVDDPADLYLAGPLRQAAGRIGVVVTGDVLVPYWSHPVEGDLDLDVDLAVLGRSSADLVRSLPSTVPANAQNSGTALRFRGAWALTRGAVGLVGFDDVSTTLSRPRAPWWSASTGWRTDSMRRLTAAELADPSDFS